MPVTLQLTVPYLVFLGHVPSMAYAKTAMGIAQWTPESCIDPLVKSVDANRPALFTKL